VVGDDLAAEYILLLLCSRIFIQQRARKEEEDPHGLFPLHLSGAEPAAIPPLLDMVRNLMPRVVCTELTAPFLSQHRLLPRKDYDHNRLLAGLQLAPGTVLLLDETKTAEGKLDAQGVQSLDTLRSVVRQQTLPVDFDNYTVRFETELPCLFVSRQATSIMPNVDLVTVPLPGNPAAEPVTGVDFVPLRRYLAAVRSFSEPLAELTPGLLDLVESTFVGARQADPMVTQQSLSTWLTLARSLAASYGETQLSEARWAEIMRLEEMRRKRLHG
jgi:hypothetical protein